MHRKLIRILLPVAAIIASSAVNANSGLRCEAKLSGAQTTGNVETDASGKLVAKFDAAFTEVDVRLRVRGAPDASRAHFHCARPGANGPIAFGLFAPGPLSFNGRVARGTLINEDFNGAECDVVDGNFVDRPVNNIAALAFAMRDGLVYINVHTPANPSGEIRGQMVCSDDDDDDDHDRRGRD